MNEEKLRMDGKVIENELRRERMKVLVGKLEWESFGGIFFKFHELSTLNHLSESPSQIFNQLSLRLQLPSSTPLHFPSSPQFIMANYANMNAATIFEDDENRSNVSSPPRSIEKSIEYPDESRTASPCTDVIPCI
jgi:hypothetical protein